MIASASAASAAEAARLGELEAAQRAAAAALESELGLLRRQKAEAEDRGRQHEAQVRGGVEGGWEGGSMARRNTFLGILGIFGYTRVSMELGGLFWL